MEEQKQITSENMTGLSLEDAFTEIEKIIADLEDDEITLEDSFREYHKGMQLLKYCNDAIDGVEKKVMKIDEEGDLNEF